MKILISIVICVIIVVIFGLIASGVWGRHVEGLRKTRASLDSKERIKILKYF